MINAPNVIRNDLALKPLSVGKLAAYSDSNSDHGIIWAIFTQELVAKFYENLRSQMSKAEALKEAQKALINQNKNIHPAKWASFILIGNWL
jgi:CHAT domain